MCKSLVSGKLLQHGRNCRMPVEMLIGTLLWDAWSSITCKSLFRLARTLVRVVQRGSCVGHASVRYLCKDAAGEQNGRVSTEPLLLAMTSALHYEAVDSRGDRPHDLVGAVHLRPNFPEPCWWSGSEAAGHKCFRAQPVPQLAYIIRSNSSWHWS